MTLQKAVSLYKDSVKFFNEGVASSRLRRTAEEVYFSQYAVSSIAQDVILKLAKEYINNG